MKDNCVVCRNPSMYLVKQLRLNKKDSVAVRNAYCKKCTISLFMLSDDKLYKVGLGIVLRDISFSIIEKRLKMFTPKTLQL